MSRYKCTRNLTKYGNKHPEDITKYVSGLLLNITYK